MKKTKKLILIYTILLIVGSIALVVVYRAPIVRAIAGFHQAGGGPKSKMGYPSHQPAAITNGLVGWWKMDGDGIDSSPTGLTSTVDPLVTDAAGKFGAAKHFDGGSHGVVVNNNSVLNITGDLTLSAWVKHTSSNNYYSRFFDKIYWTAETVDYSLGIRWTGGSACLELGNGTTVVPACSTATISTSQWHYIVGTVSGTTMTVYVDGVASGTPVTFTGTRQNHSIPLVIGCSGSLSGCNSGYYVGEIDDARIYNRALTADEITTLYRGSAPPACDQSCVGWWKMDETSWTKDCTTLSVIDSSGQGNNGKSCPTTTGPAGGSTGVYANGGYFDGSNDYVDAGNNAAFVLNNTSHTFSAWAKVPALPAEDFAALFTRYAGGTPGSGYTMFMSNTTGRLSFAESADGGNSISISPTTNYADDAWHLFTVTVDTAAKSASWYTDGKFISSDAYTGDLINYDSSLYVGGNTTSANWKGYVDDIRIYNRALQPYEIYNLYAAGR